MPLRLTTILSRNPAVLEHHIQKIVKAYAGHDLTCFFALSGNESVDWTKSWRLLRSINERETAGCLSSPLTAVEDGGGRDFSSFLACSIGIFERDEAVCFRSDIRGDPLTQVGRWHSFRKTEEDAREPFALDGKVSWEDVWSRGSEVSKLPSEKLADVNPDDISSIIYFTERGYQGLSRSLLQHYPKATKLGLIATSTLTVTSLPATLLYQDHVHDNGAVGLALKRPASSPSVDFQGIQLISKPMKVTNSQGNIIHTLNNQNATALLLDALAATSAGEASHSPMHQFVNDRIFLGVLDATGKLSAVQHITAGDPSRGSVVLAGERGPAVGSTIQFFLRPSDSPISLAGHLPRANLAFDFVTVPELISSVEPNVEDQEAVSLDNVFLAASDVGVVLHKTGDAVESVGLGCPVGSFASLQLQ